MAAQSNLKNMVMVLGLTCLLCSAVLGGAYALTKEPIDAAAKAKTDKAIGAVLPTFDETSSAYDGTSLTSGTTKISVSEGDVIEIVNLSSSKVVAVAYVTVTASDIGT